MRTDYFDDLLPASVTHVTQPKKDCVTPVFDSATSKNSDLPEPSRTSRMSRTETGDTEQTRPARRVFQFRLTDNPAEHLVMLAMGCNLDEATEGLRRRFGQRLIDVIEYTWQTR